jgi:ubiquinone/menaquinone biosynthesis C-methylase UbiE
MVKTDEMLRVRRSPIEARDAYNRLSGWYDLLAGASEGPLCDLGLTLLDVQLGERVLEIGFGTGRGLATLARAVGPAGAVFGLDISDGMARLALQRLRDAGLDDRVLVCLGNGARPGFVPGSCDAIFMSFTLELFDTPELPSVLWHCRRLLRRGGRLGVVSLVKERRRERWPVRLYEWVHRLLPKWVDCRPIYLWQILTEGGFTITVSERRSMWGLPVDAVIAQPSS